MNAPDKCPRCGLPAQIDDDGAPSVRYGGQLYQCWTVVDPKSGEVDEDWHCLTRQRDQLAARVADAERERDQALAVLGAYKMDKEALAARVNAIQVELAFAEEAFLQRLRRIDALEARVKELEAYEAICKNPAALWTNWLRGTVALPAGIGDVRQEQARVRELEAWIADLDEIGRHSGKSEHREWNGEIGWLLHGQVAYVGEVKP